MSGPVSQFSTEGTLRHFLTIEGLSRSKLSEILDLARSFAAVGQRSVKSLPILRGKTIVNLFFEPSTRTKMTFELAAKRLSADVLDLEVARSSTGKGESLSDTLKTLVAMHCDMFVVRHNQSGAAHYIASQVDEHVSIINAGDGSHAHPTQALLDMMTISKYKPDFSKLIVTIIGDVLHSRVARSDIAALKLLGTKEIRVAGPQTLVPTSLNSMGIKTVVSLSAGLEGADVIIVLRLQKERMSHGLLPSEEEYAATYGLTHNALQYAQPDAIVLHPGPINRGVEIASNVADSAHSLILEQVSHGIAVRMAIMAVVMGHRVRGEHGEVSH